MAPQVGYSIADLTELKAISAANRFNGYSRLVLEDANGKPSWFTFVATSSEVSDEDTIVDPDSGTGQWIKANDFVNAYPLSHTHWHEDSIVVAGTNLVNFTNSNQRFNAYTCFQTSNLNDSFKFYATLKAGSYVMNVLGFTSSIGGILTCEIDDIPLQNNFDWYGDSWSVTHTGSFNLDNSGTHKFLFRVVDKNSSSSGYFIPITRFHIRREEVID